MIVIAYVAEICHHPIVIKKLTQILSVTILVKRGPVFTSLQYKSFENSMGKGEIAHKQAIFLFPTLFFTCFGELSINFIKFEIVVCKLFKVWKCQTCHLEQG